MPNNGVEIMILDGNDNTINIPDDKKITFGNADDLRIFHETGNTSKIENYTGNLTIQQRADDSSIVFQCDDGSGGLTEYFRVDGANEVISFTKPPKLFDNVQLSIGNASDLRIYHNSTNSLIDNIVGDISIRQLANDKDIRFRCDDGSGGETEYFRLDGGLEKMVSSKNIMWLDNIKAQFGDSNDLRIYHNGTNNIVESVTGNLIIQNNLDDQDIILKSDDGSGGVTEYFRLDGSSTSMQASKNIVFADGIRSTYGGGADFAIYHTGTTNNIEAVNGKLRLIQTEDEGDISFEADDGSGGITEYFRVDSTDERTIFSKGVKTLDSVNFIAGTGNDLKIRHNGTNSFIENNTGNLEITNTADDKDIIFKSDDGSGGTTTYFRLDGSFASAGTVYTSFPDNSRATFGNNFELNIYHDGGNSLIVNSNGELLIRDNDTIRLQKNNGENMLRAVADGEVELYHNNVKKLDTRTTGIRITGVSEYADNTAAIAGGLTTGDVYRTGDLLKIVH